MIEIVARGRPAPRGSRIAMKTKDGRPYTRSASKYEQPWINAVRDATRNVMRHHEQLSPPYVVDLTFLLAAPRQSSHDWPTAADLDKLVRAVIDGLQIGGALVDDRHVVELHARKHYADDPADAGVIALISEAAIVAV